MPCIWHRWGEWEEYQVGRVFRNGVWVDMDAHEWRRRRICSRCREVRDQVIHVVRRSVEDT